MFKKSQIINLFEFIKNQKYWKSFVKNYYFISTFGHRFASENLKEMKMQYVLYN